MRDIVKMTLGDQIYTILREDIINQNIKCGEKLTLKALQERFGLSSTPIREAIRRLSQEDLVEHVTNVGARVVTIDENDIKEIYDFCSVLDVAALKFALKGEKADEAALELNKSIELQEQALKSGNMNEFKIHSDNFHDILFKYADNSRLYSSCLRIRSQFTILTNIYQTYTNAESVVFKGHKDIAEAFANKDYNKAELLMINHFEYAKNYLLNNIKNSGSI